MEVHENKIERAQKGENSLKYMAFKGVLWSAIEGVSVQGIQFVLSIIIARLVLPSEYGLIAMLSIFLAIAQVFVDSGFSNALIQKKKRTEIDCATVFYFNIIISLIVYLLLFISAPYIALFYKEPELTLVTRWVGLNIVISSLSIVQRAKLIINVDFKTQAKASLVAVILSGIIGIWFAYIGFGVWALVFQSLSNSLLNTILLWIFTKWIPIWTFSWESFKTLFSFGSKLLLSGLLHTIYINLYSLVIGKKYSPENVGFYNRSYQLASFPSIGIIRVISRVIYPVQCKLQDDDERLKTSFIQYLRLACYVVFPLMISIAVLSKPLVLIILTDKWLPSAKLLSILCFAYMWYPVMVINNQILNVKGYSNYFLKAEIIKKLMAICILIITLPFGVKILCYGIVFYNFIDLSIIIHYVKKTIRTGYKEQFIIIYPLFLSSLFIGSIIYFVTQLFDGYYLFQLVIGGVILFVSYVLMGFLFHDIVLYRLLLMALSKLR